MSFYRMEKDSLKRHLPKILIIVLLIIGLGLVFYPTLSNWLNERNASRVIDEYSEVVSVMDPADVERHLEMAQTYNSSLTGSAVKDPFIPGSGVVLPDNYVSVLNVDGKGLIGHIKIPKINVDLPIYHGTSEAVLQKAIGHMENSAFPIGGEGNHSIITGHSGLSSYKLFTDLEKMEEGDIFYILVLNDILAYEVDQILVIEPEDTSNLLPVQGEDYITLITCTPYAVNSHRLLVRGTRVPYVDPDTLEIETPERAGLDWRLMMILIFFILLALAFGIYRLVDGRRKRN